MKVSKKILAKKGVTTIKGQSLSLRKLKKMIRGQHSDRLTIDVAIIFSIHCKFFVLFKSHQQCKGHNSGELPALLAQSGTKVEQSNFHNIAGSKLFQYDLHISVFTFNQTIF
jgi:hypothetical protein